MPFQPPPASSRQLAGVPFANAVDFAAEAKARYDAFDRRPGNRDPSKCKAPGFGLRQRRIDVGQHHHQGQGTRVRALQCAAR